MMIFDMECPKCKNNIQIKTEDMTPDSKKVCKNCEAEITFSEYAQKKEQKELDDLEELLKNLFD